MAQDFDNSLESIGKLIQTSEKFFADNKIDVPFELETAFRVLGNRVKDGYADNIILNGLEGEIRILYHTFSVLENSSSIDKGFLASYGVSEAVQSKEVTEDVKAKAAELRAHWQEVAESRSVDLGLRVAECSHPDKETFANLAKFVHEHYQQIHRLQFGGLSLLGPSASDPLPNRVAAAPLGNILSFVHNLASVAQWERFYDSADEKERDSIWKSQTQFRDNLPRGDETMSKFLEMIDQIKANNSNIPASTEQTLNNIYTAVSDLKNAYGTTGITMAIDMPERAIENSPIEKLINFTKRLASPQQPQDTSHQLNQNDVTGNKGLGKPPLPPGKSSDDTPHR
jgi:hypothetical protein